jgi:thioredoxin-dependent peroxiredoxin
MIKVLSNLALTAALVLVEAQAQAQVQAPTPPLTPPAPAETMLLPVGAAAPEVEGKDPAGAVVKLSGQRGKFAVVYFYPKDESPGCTKEACAFRDSFDKLAQAGITVFAVSRDPEASHKGFREHYKLPFPMVADVSGAVQRAYRVREIKRGLSKRVTFLVGPDGKIAKVWPDVDPGVNATQVLDAVAAAKRAGRG